MQFLGKWGDQHLKKSLWSCVPHDGTDMWKLGGMAKYRRTFENYGSATVHIVQLFTVIRSHARSFTILNYYTFPPLPLTVREQFWRMSLEMLSWDADFYCYNAQNSAILTGFEE